MTIAQIRKALVATLGAFLSALTTAWLAQGKFPGWSAVGAIALGAAAVGLGTWATPNARAVPEAVQRLRDQAAARVSTAYAGYGQKPATVTNVPPRPSVAPPPPPPSGS